MNKQFNMRMPKEELDMLQDISRVTGLNASTIVRIAIRRIYRDKKVTIALNELKKIPILRLE